MAWQIVLLIVAVVLFVLAAVGIGAPRVSLGWLGLACFAAYFLFASGVGRL